MKKITLLNGSPHAQGCTTALAEKVAAAAECSGAAVTSFFLNSMRIQGCQGCFQCQKTGRCAVQDDMQLIYDALADSDAVVLASPVYMWSMSAQLKAPVDRLFASLRPEHQSALKPGIKVLLLFTQGQPDTEMFRHYFEHVGRNMQFMGFGEYRILVAGGTHSPEQVTAQDDVMAAAEAAGLWLSDSSRDRLWTQR
jgi:multimeric flavodoxin WrbA